MNERTREPFFGPGGAKIVLFILIVAIAKTVAAMVAAGSQ